MRGAEEGACPTQLAMVAEFGCDVVQGYIYSRPMPASDFTRWLDSQR